MNLLHLLTSLFRKSKPGYFPEWKRHTVFKSGKEYSDYFRKNETGIPVSRSEITFEKLKQNNPSNRKIYRTEAERMNEIKH
jgi:hypothetical protein